MKTEYSQLRGLRLYFVHVELLDAGHFQVTCKQAKHISLLIHYPKLFI